MSMPGLTAQASLYQADGRRQMIGTFVAPADGRRIVPQPWGAPSGSSGSPDFWRCDGCRQLCEFRLAVELLVAMLELSVSGPKRPPGTRPEVLLRRPPVVAPTLDDHTA